MLGLYARGVRRLAALAVAAVAGCGGAGEPSGGPLDVVEDTTPDPSLDEFPTVARLSHELSQDHAGEEFEFALEQLLERITMLKVDQAG